MKWRGLWISNLNTIFPQHDFPLFDPKNDFVFKRLFADAPDLLIALINDVRVGEPEITQLEVLNPVISPEELSGKCIVLDIKAQDEREQRYNIEMQVRRFDAWHARSAFYLARMLSQQLGQGEDYTRLKPAIGIHLLDFDLFQAPEHQSQAMWCFEMRDRVQPAVRLGKELQLNLIELRKADKLGLASQPLNTWITFFEHWQEEQTMADIAYEPVKSALTRLKTLSADEEAQRMAFVRERAMHDEASLIVDAIRRGQMEGELNMLVKQLNRKFGPLPDDITHKLQHATIEQLTQWGENVLFADSLNDVFASES